MTRDTYSDRERAIRAEIEKQAPDLKLKYVTEFKPHEMDGRSYQQSYAAFVFPDGPVGFSVVHDVDIPTEFVAAHLIASARYELAKRTVSDAFDWSKP